MAEPKGGGIVSVLWRMTVAVLAAALVVDFAGRVLRCNWVWVVSGLAVVGTVVGLTWWLRNRSPGW